SAALSRGAYTRSVLAFLFSFGGLLVACWGVGGFGGLFCVAIFLVCFASRKQQLGFINVFFFDDFFFMIFCLCGNFSAFPVFTFKVCFVTVAVGVYS
ncbi:hypothetical protein ACQWFZ_24365, partial [Salmonella enterica subsp. enterica serovar Infantis]